MSGLSLTGQAYKADDTGTGDSITDCVQTASIPYWNELIQPLTCLALLTHSVFPGVWQIEPN